MINLKIDDLQGPEIAALLQLHLDDMAAHSPPESVHALDLNALRQPGITFWTAWDCNELLGCGALKQLNAHEGEIKSMRTAGQHLRKGVAQMILKQILDEAKRRHYRRLNLETGSMQVFEPARAMYERAGFCLCQPFADYVEDDYSVFMTMEL